MIKISENRPAMPLAKEWTLLWWNIQVAVGGANRTIGTMLAPIEIRQ
jgi:hypothetical protein